MLMGLWISSLVEKCILTLQITSKPSWAEELNEVQAFHLCCQVWRTDNRNNHRLCVLMFPNVCRNCPGSAFWRGLARVGLKYPTMRAAYGSTDGMYLGGVMVVSKEPNSEIILLHLEEIGNIAENEAIVSAIRTVKGRSSLTSVASREDC